MHLIGQRRLRHDALHDPHLAVLLVRVQQEGVSAFEGFAAACQLEGEARGEALQARPLALLRAFVDRLLGQVEAALLLQREEQVDDAAVARHGIERHPHPFDLDSLSHFGVQAGHALLQAVVHRQVLAASEKRRVSRLHLQKRSRRESGPAQQRDGRSHRSHQNAAAHGAAARRRAAGRTGVRAAFPRPLPPRGLQSPRGLRARRCRTILGDGSQRRVHVVELGLRLARQRTRIQRVGHRPPQLVLVVEVLPTHRATSASLLDPSL